MLKPFKSLKELGALLPCLITNRFKDEFGIVVASPNIPFSLTFLKKHFNHRFQILSCISGVDFLVTNYRFSVVYDLLSLKYNTRLKVKTFVNEVTPIPSSCDVFVNANWWEREIWDLFGIYFDNHPDLRRILTDYGFEGHPMRKDFPLIGYIEVRYDESKKRVVTDSVEMTQEFRFFNYETPW